MFNFQNENGYVMYFGHSSTNKKQSQFSFGCKMIMLLIAELSHFKRLEKRINGRIVGFLRAFHSS